MSPLQALNFATLVLLAVLHSAASTEHIRRQVYAPQPDTSLIIASVSAYDGLIYVQPINASNKTYWIGKPTTTLALLSSNQTQGPPTAPSTVLQHQGASLWTSGAVPSQRNYIAANGASSFLPPCQQTFPQGLIHGHFNATLFYPQSRKGFIGHLNFTPDLPRALGLRDPYYGGMAWPSDGAGGPSQIFAALKGLKDMDVSGGHVKDWVDIIIITSNPGEDHYHPEGVAVAAY